eukprot:gb/GEZN01000683.1/.p1 GENE.gb/GEZN01000683.1/~~gb/GEZN01000683.1/.p1  ORF type:complete len:1160 (+),score=147.68 gb/GEZN01000683.1/:150-3629(+)
MSEIEFLHSENVAGQNLLQLVARGNAIIAELLRLSDHIPSVFLGSPTDPTERAKYAPILFDFVYLKQPEYYDNKLEEDLDTGDLDEDFRENNFELLERFYQLFESVYRYIQDWNTYLEELIDGVFVQHTVEGVLLDVEGKQLMCEALYLYGVMLLLMDLRIPGETRERMIVSYYRYKGSGAGGIATIDQVVKLCARTGWSPGKRPKNYPEEYFGRIPISEEVITMILARLRADDIYNHVQAYPSPNHRGAALASQASMLYVILFFLPKLMHEKTAIMREIVDKHFADNWVITFYMGFTADLTDAWAPFTAANKALANVVSRENVSEILQNHVESVPGLLAGLDKYLTEGVLLDEFVLDNIRKLVRHVRDCNVALRWFLLHRTTVQEKLRQQIQQSVDNTLLIRLLMNTAQYEFKLKGMLTRLLESKADRWNECKAEASSHMLELSEYFSGEKPLTRVAKNENLQKWFLQLGTEIRDSLDIDQAVLSGRKIAQLISALEDVEEFHQIESSLHVKTFLEDTRLFLKKMIRTVNINQTVVANLDIVSDFSYSWHVINGYTQILHEKIKSNPRIVLLLRATFIKLGCILDKPLTRITQCDSKDAVSVAEYYSSSLVGYVRRVLEVIPQSVFKLLDGIIKLQTHNMKPVPTKFERKFLKDYAQMEQRYSLAKSTHQVSVFTEGVLAMHTTLLGIIKLNPHQLLEEGIRKELVLQIATALNDFLVFKSGALSDFEKRITLLGQKLDGFRQSFEYIQDYINMYGLKIWQQEFSRIINYSIEQESNEFLRKRVYDWQSTFQSEAIPIPRFPRNKHNPDSVNFMGRLTRELLRQTDPSLTTYVEAMQGWYDEKETEVIGIRTFSLIHRALGIFGLTGIDRLVSFMVVRDLTKFLRMYRKTVDKRVTKFLFQVRAELHPTSQFPDNSRALYRTAEQKTSKLWPAFLELVTKIGCIQLLRRQIANELNFSAKMDSKILSSTLENLNNALITDVKKHYSDPGKYPNPGAVLPAAAKYLENTGVSNPITKIYVTTEPLPGVPVLMFLFTLSQVTQLQWNSKLCTLTPIKKIKKVPLDGAPFVVGMITILKQFHSSHTHTYLAYLGQFVRAKVSSGGSGSSSKPPSIPAEVIAVLLFLEEFCRFSHTSRKAIEGLIPSYLFDRFCRTVVVSGK